MISQLNHVPCITDIKPSQIARIFNFYLNIYPSVFVSILTTVKVMLKLSTLVLASACDHDSSCIVNHLRLMQDCVSAQSQQSLCL